MYKQSDICSFTTRFQTEHSKLLENWECTRLSILSTYIVIFKSYHTAHIVLNLFILQNILGISHNYLFPTTTLVR